jgi:hypothetical protein
MAALETVQSNKLVLKAPGIKGFLVSRQRAEGAASP